MAKAFKGRESTVSGHTTTECNTLYNLAMWDYIHENDHFTFFEPSDEDVKELEELHSQWGCTWLAKTGSMNYSAEQFKIAIEKAGTMYPNWHLFMARVKQDEKLVVVFYSEKDNLLIGVKAEGVPSDSLHWHSHELTKGL